MKCKIWAEKVWTKVFKFLGHLQYITKNITTFWFKKYVISGDMTCTMM